MSDFRISNHSRKLGKRGDYDWFEWEVFLDEPPERLRQVRRVTYQLHPTFPDPIRVKEDPSTGFRLRASGWGEFDVVARIELEGGAEIVQNYWLRLGDQPGSHLVQTIHKAKPDVGATLFGKDPIAGEATLAGYGREGLEMEIRVGKRSERAILRTDGSIAVAAVHGRAPRGPLIRSRAVEGTVMEPFIEVAGPDGKPRRLDYSGPTP